MGIGVGLGVRHAQKRRKNSFSPADLFASAEDGAFYDPSDRRTLWQDAAGTIPVTKLNDPVRRMDDKSGNGYHMIAPSDDARPVYKTDGVSHWLEPDATDDWMKPDSALDLGDVWSHVGGWRLDVSPGNAFGTDDSPRGPLIYTNALASWGMRNTANAAYIAVTTGVDETDQHVLTLEQSDATTVSSRYNGTTSLSSVGIYDTGVETRGLALFSRQNDLWVQGFGGRFYGGVWIKRALTSAERSNTETFFTRKSGLNYTPKIAVFALMGQSNMLGVDDFDDNGDYRPGTLDWDGDNFIEAQSPLTGAGAGKMGLTITFADAFLADNPQYSAVAFIQTAVSGSNIGSWNSTGNANYDAAVVEINQALAALDADARVDHTFAGFLWHQGESNSTTPPVNHSTILAGIADDFRTDITEADSTTPFVMGEIYEVDAGDIEINEDINTASTLTAYAAVASSDGLTTIDDTHFDAASLRIFGERYYTAYKEALLATP